MTPRARACGAAAIVLAVAGLVGTVGATPATAATRSGFGKSAGAERYAGAGRAEDWQAGQWWVDKSKLKERHAQGLTGHGVDIALIDGPVNTSIPELAGQDVRPTFSTCDESTKEDGPLTPDGPLDDTSFHTTSMAALLVGNGKGTGPGGAGITGVAPGATLRTYSIFNTTDPSKHQNYMCDLTAMPALIDRVVADGADIVEIPVTLKGYSDAFRAAVNRAITKGVLLVAGAGNDGPGERPMPPADLTGILVVGGFTSDAKVYPKNPTSISADWESAARSTGSRYEIHLLGPATNILAGAVVNGKWDSNQLQSGTSGASAVVAGQLALMKQKWPTATSNQLLSSLLRNANRVQGEPVWTPRGGFGTSSFENTLSTDPSAYPDVQPIYGTLGNVFSDHPVPQFIPVTLDGEGHLATQPPSTPSTGSSTTLTAPAAPATTRPPTALPTGASRADAERGSGGFGGWLAGGISALAVLALAALVLVRRNRTGRPTVSIVNTAPSNTAAEGKEPP